MKRKSTLASAVFALGAAVGFASGCQTGTTGTQTKELTARNLTPNVMLLVDRSASMDFPVNPAAANCQSSVNSGSTCGTTKSDLCDVNPSSASYCPTRWTELQSAASDFLSNAGASARLGLAVFPTLSQGGSTPQQQCGITSDASQPQGEETRLDLVQSDAAADLQAQADQIKASILAITSQPGADVQNVTLGGTPVTLSIRSLGTNARLTDPSREDFVLLLTDGVPNCNPDNPNDYASSSCRCTLATCTSGSANLGCLDKTGAVTELIKLRSKGVRTLVVGFGPEVTSGDGLSALNAMAQAGGMARECPDGSDAACGEGNTCNTASKLCNFAFYTAADRAQLAAVLNGLNTKVKAAAACTYALEEKPTDAQHLVVELNGVNTPTGSDAWTYDATRNVVMLSGATCAQAQGGSAPAVRVFQGT